MQSRFGRVIQRHGVSIGITIIGISFLWLMGTAGAEDYAAEFHIVTSFGTWLLRTAIGIGGMIAGTVIANMGEDE